MIENLVVTQTIVERSKDITDLLSQDKVCNYVYWKIIKAQAQIDKFKENWSERLQTRFNDQEWKKI